MAGTPALLFNKTRELIPLPWQHYFPHGWDAPPILSQTRLQRLFANQPQFYEPYNKAIEAVAASNATQIGMVLSFNAWEYPIWALLRARAPGRSFRVEHVDGPPPYTPANPSTHPTTYPLGSFAPEALFWNRGEGEAPATLVVGGQEFRRIFQSDPISFHKDTIAVFVRTGPP
jgi:hypothetical protein